MILANGFSSLFMLICNAISSADSIAKELILKDYMSNKLYRSSDRF